MEQLEYVKLMLSRRNPNLNVNNCKQINNDSKQYIIDNAVFVAIIEFTKVTNDVLKSILGAAKNYKQIIIVYAQSLTSGAKAILSENVMPISLFTFNEMSFDLISVVPTHELCTFPKPKEWKKFPTLLTSDPVAKYYNFKKNDIIKITEDDGICMYRRVV